MDLLTSALAAVLRWTTVCLPAGRRDWGEAVWAEAGEVPAGRARLSWLIGGIWLVAREAGMIRKIGYTVTGVAAGAILVWLDWHPGSANPAMAANRITMMGAVSLLAILPWATRPLLGPVADNRVARVVRAGGYTAMYALLLVMVGLSRFASSRFDHFRAFDQANWEADMRSGALGGAVLIIAMLGGYAIAILAVTARRTSVPPTALAIGGGLGVVVALTGYALMPLGNPLHPGNGLLAAGYGLVLVLLPLGILFAAGLFTRQGQGSITGLCAGGTAALLINILTIATMLLLPRQVDLLWANPDPNVPHGTTYEIQMSVGDAAIKYEVGLLAGPLLGVILGTIGGAAMTGATQLPRAARRREEPELAGTP